MTSLNLSSSTSFAIDLKVALNRSLGLGWRFHDWKDVPSAQGERIYRFFARGGFHEYRIRMPVAPLPAPAATGDVDLRPADNFRQELTNRLNKVFPQGWRLLGRVLESPGRIRFNVRHLEGEAVLRALASPQQYAEFEQLERAAKTA